MLLILYRTHVKYTTELLRIHQEVINSHAKALGIDTIDKQALDRMLHNGLSTQSYIIGIYALNGFSDVTDINSLVKHITFKNTERVTPIYDVTL